MAKTKNTMKAVVARGVGDYRVEEVIPEYKIEEVPMPTADEGEMIVKVEACGICIGDVKMTHNQRSLGRKRNTAAYKMAVYTGTRVYRACRRNWAWSQRGFQDRRQSDFRTDRALLGM